MSPSLSDSPIGLSVMNSMSRASDPEKGLESCEESVSVVSQALPPSRMGNPGALGLFSFATTLWILSCYLVQVRGVATPNVVVGMAMFTGGLALFVSGLYHLANGNTFGGTAFAFYAGFWASYGSILLPGSGAAAAYTVPGEFESALGIFLSGWLAVTLLFFIASLRTNAAFMGIFGILTIVFTLLMSGYFVMSSSIAAAGVPGAMGINLIRAGGIAGMLLSILAWYVGLSELLSTLPGSYTLPTALPAKKSQ